jgi:hypothetical protein
LLELSGLDDFPLPASFGYCELVRARHVQDFGGSADGERVGAEHGNGLTEDSLIKRFFVFAKVCPVLRFKSERVAGNSHPAYP